MDHQTVARRLSRPAAELLLAHIDGPSFVEHPINRGKVANGTRTALIRTRLLSYTTRGPRPLATETTEDGRAVLCFVLADYADALTAAGYAIAPVGPTPVADTARLLALRTPPVRYFSPAATSVAPKAAQPVSAPE